jgi:hypothetical protein
MFLKALAVYKLTDEVYLITFFKWLQEKNMNRMCKSLLPAEVSCGAKYGNIANDFPSLI